MFRLTCLILLVNFALGLELHAKLNKQWGKFKAAHGKEYTGAEEKKRQAIFKSNVEKILQHNLQADLGEKSYTMGINEFSDMTSEEFIEIMGMKGNMSLPEDLKVSVMVRNPNVRLPSSIDWRKHNLVTPVRNQGYCNSCWAFAVVGAIEGAWAKQNRNLVSFSEQHLVDCYAKSCQGEYLHDALNYVIRNVGIASRSCYPYTAGEARGPSTCNTGCKKTPIYKYYNVLKGSEEALQEAVANRPVAVVVRMHDGMKGYRGGIFNENNCDHYKSNHAMLIVGYGSEGGKDYWLMKNSWGSHGENGYMRMARNAGNICRIANSAYYVLV